jgi:hypothetical protein
MVLWGRRGVGEVLLGYKLIVGQSLLTLDVNSQNHAIVTSIQRTNGTGLFETVSTIKRTHPMLIVSLLLHSYSCK